MNQWPVSHRDQQRRPNAKKINNSGSRISLIPIIFDVNYPVFMKNLIFGSDIASHFTVACDQAFVRCKLGSTQFSMAGSREGSIFRKSLILPISERVSRSNVGCDISIQRVLWRRSKNSIASCRCRSKKLARTRGSAFDSSPIRLSIVFCEATTSEMGRSIMMTSSPTSPGRCGRS